MQRVFEALSSTVRRKILAYLAHAELTAGDIASRFSISKPAVSQHLSILEAAGLVRSEKRGQFVHYSLVRDSLVNTLNDFVQEVCPVSKPLKEESAPEGRPRGLVARPAHASLAGKGRAAMLRIEPAEGLRQAARGDWRVLGAITAEAFAQDPVAAWTFDGKPCLRPVFQRLARDVYLPRGMRHLADGDRGRRCGCRRGPSKELPALSLLGAAARLLVDGGPRGRRARPGRRRRDGAAQAGRRTSICSPSGSCARRVARGWGGGCWPRSWPPATPRACPPIWRTATRSTPRSTKGRASARWRPSRPRPAPAAGGDVAGAFRALGRWLTHLPPPDRFAVCPPP